MLNGCGYSRHGECFSCFLRYAKAIPGIITALAIVIWNFCTLVSCSFGRTSYPEKLPSHLVKDTNHAEMTRDMV